MSTVKATLKKRIPAMIVAAMMFFTVFAVLPTTELGKVYAAGETGKVTASQLYVRSGAGTSYSKIGSLKKGKTFTITGTSKDKSGGKWYKLKYNSKTGYVSSKYINIIKPTVTSVSNLTGTVNTKKDPLTVRSGPGSGYKKLGTLAKGKSFTITGKAKDSSGKSWYRLKYSSKTGYVSASYVKTKTTTSTPTVTAVTNTTGTVTTKVNPLTIRSGPGSSYSKLGTLAKGKTFAVTGKVKDSKGLLWYQLKYNNKTAYASSNYVSVKTTKPTSSSSTSATSSSTSATGSTTSSTSSSSSSTGSSTSSTTSGSTTTTVSFKMATSTASDGLNVRTGPGTGYSVLTILPKGSTVTVTGTTKDSKGKVWYIYQYSSSKKGYICSDYVQISTITSNDEFEAYLKAQGFPETYKAGLRALHTAHPKWVFKAVKVGYNWQDALDKESVVGKNLVSPSDPVSYRSTASGSYNSKTKKWTKFDGSWYAANSKVVAYYMDPRNFLNETGIYQFMTHTYDGSSQNANTVAAIIKGSFMEKKDPIGKYTSYQDLIATAGKAAGVNPNVLAAMIIQEQGWKGSSLVSGTYKGYKGYYNFFNVGAYTTSTMSAVERGLWYAKGSGTGATSYSRPWTSPYRSIKGGAQFYAEGYVKQNQDSYYTKKFNVYNGLSKVATHQYMTFVAAAASEGSIVKKAYESNSSYPVVFEIPVYNNMPTVNCQLP